MEDTKTSDMKMDGVKKFRDKKITILTRSEELSGVFRACCDVVCIGLCLHAFEHVILCRFA